MADTKPRDAALCAAAELLDLGSGSGRSLESALRRFGLARGIGIDRNPRKVELGQERGFPVYEADITDLDPAEFPSVRVVTFDNVLEHLPSLAVVEDVVSRACKIASHLVYIRHPSFEHEDYLASLGVKQYWTDWPGKHTAHVRLHEFMAMAARNDVYRFTVRPVRRAYGSDDPTILPLDAPPNQRRPDKSILAVYDSAKHGPKPSLTFDRPVYFAFDVFLFVGAEIPSIRYAGDTESDQRRPSLSWNPDTRRTGRGLGRRVARRLRSPMRRPAIGATSDAAGD